MQPQSVLFYVSTSALPEQTQLRAGPLSLLYENGDLRYVKLGDQEILRRVYVAVRDHNWDTIGPSLSNVQMEINDDSFTIGYDVHHSQGEVDFSWRGTIVGDAQGTITFRMDGEAHSTFRRNRIGFCILHPADCSGVPARIEHVDGSIEELPFPQTIGPQFIKNGHPWPVAPFENMRALSHQVSPDIWATVRCEGDIFELEDQRNWTDASYKTYGTPLSLPFPATVEAGTRIEQSITLTLDGDISIASEGPEDDVVKLKIDHNSAKSLPQIGLGVASHGQPLTERELSRLQALNLSHLRVDLHLSDAQYSSRLQEATDQAQRLNIRLEVALFVSENAQSELSQLSLQLDQIRPSVCRWLVFHESEKATSTHWVDMAREQLAAYDPSAQIGAGSNAYFTEVNAVQPDPTTFDFITYSINPQVHAFDNSSLVETLEAQAVTVESAKHLAKGKEIVVSPVTLLPRFNPNATGPEPEPEPGELPSQVEPRQMSLFGAGWTVGSLKYLGGSALTSVTYYETTGWRGVMETAKGSPLPDLFHSQPEMVFPLYHVLADAGEFADGEILALATTDPLRVDGFALRRGNKMRLLIANLTPDLQRIQLRDVKGNVQARLLDETTFERSTMAPEAYRSESGAALANQDGKVVSELLPYSVLHIDVEAGSREDPI